MLRKTQLNGSLQGDTGSTSLICNMSYVLTAVFSITLFCCGSFQSYICIDKCLCKLKHSKLQYNNWESTSLKYFLQKYFYFLIFKKAIFILLLSLCSTAPRSTLPACNSTYKQWLMTNVTKAYIQLAYWLLIKLRPAFISVDTDLTELLRAPLLHSSDLSCSNFSCLVLFLHILSDLFFPVQLCCNLSSLILFCLALHFVLASTDPGQGC